LFALPSPAKILDLIRRSERLIKAVGYSVAAQGLASAGNLVVSVLLLRFLPIAEFGTWGLLYVIGASSAAFTSSVTGFVFHLCMPRFAHIKRVYEKAYNGLNLIAVAVASTLFSLATFWFVPVHGVIGLSAIPVFIFALTAIENIKLQATANNQHRAMFLVELARQIILVGAVACLGWSGQIDVYSLLLVHGTTGLAATAALMGLLHWRATFNRLAWVWDVHYFYARHLLPSVIISFFHVDAIQLLVTQRFGFGAMGHLRAAELPFSTLNPVKQSLNYFLPRAIYQFEIDSRIDRARMLPLIGLAAILATFAVAMGLWLVAQPLFPLLTNKDYPAGLGFMFALAQVAMIVHSLTSHYLNTVRKSQAIMLQSIFGGFGAMATYFATYEFFGVMAAPLAIFIAYLIMASHGIYEIHRHIGEQRPVLQAAE